VSHSRQDILQLLVWGPWIPIFKIPKYTAENRDVDIYYCGELLAPCSHSIANEVIKFSKGTSVATPGVAGLVCLLIQCAKKHGHEMKRKHFALNALKQIIVKDGSVVVPHLRKLIDCFEKEE